VKDLKIIGFCLSTLLLVRCDQIKFEPSNKGEVIAKVFDKKLHLEDVVSLTASATTPEDSILILRGYINNWIKDQLLVKEAEANMTPDIDIEKLVKDYRASLLQSNYVERLVNKELDTLITHQEMEEYYENYKQQYVLGETIIKYKFIKMNKSYKSKVNDLNKLWTQNKFESATEFAKTNAIYYHNTSDWELLNSLLILFPKNSINESGIKSNLKIDKEDKEYKYYVKVENVFRKGEVPPLEYISSKITKVILNDRKTDLIKKKKESLFEQYQDDSNVKTYLDE